MKSFSRFISNKLSFSEGDTLQHYRQFADAQSSKWLHELGKVIQIIEECVGERYILIKLPTNPWKIDVSDIDVCLCSPADIVKLSKKLEIEGYKLYGFRLLTHPLKTLAIKPGSEFSVDLYFGIRWLSIKVHRCIDIYMRRKRKKYYGYNVIVPSAEDDLYIRATHAFYHGEITLADVLQGIDLVENESLNVDYLVMISKKFGMIIPLLIYLLSMSFVYDLIEFKDSTLIQEIISALDSELNNKITKKIIKLDKLKKSMIEFPFKISTFSMIISTVENIKSVKYHNLFSAYNALLTPFLIKTAKVIKG
ncbi:MAG: hypothetical protein QXJ64_05375 [Thermosphaera sp.]